MFYKYLAQLNEIAQKRTHEDFVAIQKIRANILNSYTTGELATGEKRVLYTASSIIMNDMRKALGL